MLQAAPGKIVFRFHARDLHLVLGPAKDGKPVRFMVKLDGTPPGDDHGSDTDANWRWHRARAPPISAHPAKGSGGRQNL